MSSEVEESGEYENFLGKKEELPEPASLADFLGIPAEEADEKVFWQKHWQGMPEFNQEENPPHRKLIISFRSEEDYQEFATLIGQKLTKKTKSVWHPKLDRDANTLKRLVEE